MAPHLSEVAQRTAPVEDIPGGNLTFLDTSRVNEATVRLDGANFGQVNLLAYVGGVFMGYAQL